MSVHNSYTSTKSINWFGLGSTPGQRSAEIVAGIRAVTQPSSEADHMSSASGRFYAKLLLSLNGNVGVRNATAARHFCMTTMATSFLKERKNPQMIVEMAAGFSARALQLARQFPKVKTIEIDQPEVVAAKEERMRKVLQGKTPSNLSWIGAKLDVSPLTELIGNAAADLVIAEGIFPYFAKEEITAIAKSVKEALQPGGALICDLVSSAGWKEVEQSAGLGAWMFRRQAGRFTGSMSSTDEAKQVLLNADFSQVVVYPQKKYSQEIGFGKEAADVSFLALCIA